MDITLGDPNLGKREHDAVLDVLDSGELKGGGQYDKKSSALIEEAFGAERAMTTTSCTHALETAAMLLEIGSGDEVIVPSYTFPSTANAFVLRGADIAFCEVKPTTMNMDPAHLEDLVTEETACIVPVHYAGVACEMDAILDIAGRYDVPVVEDAAQGVNATYEGSHLGTIGTIGCYSFHGTKNYSAGEGGAILLNDTGYIEQCEYIRQKGTNYEKFSRGEVDRYTWVHPGSSYVPSEMQTALIYEQLSRRDEITSARARNYELYCEGLSDLESTGVLRLPQIPKNRQSNYHIFHIRTVPPEDRDTLMTYLRERGIGAASHYEPLHSSRMGKRFGYDAGDLPVSERVSKSLLRLPVHDGLEATDIQRVIDAIHSFYN
jgi:dTDP-4-amino-4,6-dideoxygalactose transaminase